MVRVEDGRATIAGAGTELTGRAMDPLTPGSNAVLMARGDDVISGEKGRNTIEATVETIEYRGREYVGIARTETGMEMVFHGPQEVGPGAIITLGIDASHALVFAGEA